MIFNFKVEKINIIFLFLMEKDNIFEKNIIQEMIKSWAEN